MRFVVYQNGARIGETDAGSEAQAVNQVRFRMFGARSADGLGLTAEPAVVRVDASSLVCSRGAILNYRGARVIRRRG